jgi:hypothetical protein
MVEDKKTPKNFAVTTQKAWTYSSRAVFFFFQKKKQKALADEDLFNRYVSKT